jgi:hypothetical protein
VIKHNFDQTPILLETFDQVIRSSEIRSSDPLSLSIFCGMHQKVIISFRENYKKGHGELLELRLLEKSARHDFIIARHHSSNNIFSCHLLESS